MFNANLEENTIQLMQESKKALHNIKVSKMKKEKDLFETLAESFNKYDSGRHLYEEYDVVDFEAKSKVDMLYYSQLLSKIEEADQVEKIHKLLIELTKNVKNVYEITNLKPEIYGRGINVDILENSNEEVRNKLAKRIFEYLDSNFYKLSPELRKKKYFNESTEIAKKLITEGVNSEESIEYSVKVVVMENLLKKIAFPFSVWSRINNLMESEIYSKVFDRDRLVETVNKAEKTISALAKIIAGVV